MVLAGRKKEIAMIEKSIEAGRVVILEGEAGMGKSAVIGEFCRGRKCRIGYCEEAISYSPLNQILKRYARIKRGYNGGRIALIHEHGNRKLRDIYEKTRGKKVYLEEVDKNLEFVTYPRIMNYLREGYAVFVENFNYIYYIDEEMARKILRDGKREGGKLIFSGNIMRIDGETLHIFDEVSLFDERGNNRSCQFRYIRENGDIEINRKMFDLKRLYFEVFDFIKSHKGKRILIDLDDIIEYNGFEKSYIWLKDICDTGADIHIYARSMRDEELGDISLIANLDENIKLKKVHESAVMDIAWSKYRLEDVEKEKLKIFDALTEFINKKLKNRIMVIENLERCDSSTLEFLRYYIRNKDRGVGLVITIRSEERRNVDYLIGENVDVIHLPKIGYEEARNIISGMRRMREEDMKEIYKRSEGNPQFLIELASLYDEKLRYGDMLPIPNNIREAVERRLKNLNDIQYNLIRVASVIGYEVDIQALKILYPLWDEIRNMGDFFSQNKFKSGIYREVAYSLLPDGIKIRLHRILGEFYENRDIFKSCNHYYGAGDRRGIEICYTSGRILENQYSMGDALRYLKQAYELIKKHRVGGRIKREIYHAIGEIYYMLGRYHEALDMYGGSRGLSLDKARIYFALGEHEKALKILRNHIRYAKGIDKGRTYGDMGSIYSGRSKYDLAERYYKKYLWISVKERSYIDIAKAYRGLGNICLSRGEIERGLKYYEMDYKISKNHGDLIEMSKALNNMGHAYFEKSNYDRVLDLLNESKK